MDNAIIHLSVQYASPKRVVRGVNARYVIGTNLAFASFVLFYYVLYYAKVYEGNECFVLWQG